MDKFLDKGYTNIDQKASASDKVSLHTKLILGVHVVVQALLFVACIVTSILFKVNYASIGSPAGQLSITIVMITTFFFLIATFFYFRAVRELEASVTGPQAVLEAFKKAETKHAARGWHFLSVVITDVAFVVAMGISTTRLESPEVLSGVLGMGVLGTIASTYMFIHYRIIVKRAKQRFDYPMSVSGDQNTAYMNNLPGRAEMA